MGRPEGAQGAVGVAGGRRKGGVKSGRFHWSLHCPPGHQQVGGDQEGGRGHPSGVADVCVSVGVAVVGVGWWWW